MPHAALYSINDFEEVWWEYQQADERKVGDEIAQIELGLHKEASEKLESFSLHLTTTSKMASITFQSLSTFYHAHLLTMLSLLRW